MFDGRPVVDSIDLDVPVGSFLGVVGPNGAGKTTTLSMVTGLLRPDAGRIVLAGVNVWADPVAATTNMGVLPDGLRLFERLTGGTAVLPRPASRNAGHDGCRPVEGADRRPRSRQSRREAGRRLFHRHRSSARGRRDGGPGPARDDRMAVPATALAVLALSRSPVLGWAALIVGPACGIAAIVVLSAVADTTYLSRTPEILGTVAAGDRS